MHIQPLIKDYPYFKSDLAQIVGVTEQTVSKWERGEATPQKRFLEKLEEELSMQHDDKKIHYHPSYGYATEAQIKRWK